MTVTRPDGGGRAATAPGGAPLPSAGLGEAVLRRLHELGDQPLLHPSGAPGDLSLTGGDLAERVQATADALRAQLAPGDRLLLLGPTNADWLVCDVAALVVGAVSVPVYPSASPAQIAHLASDSGAVLAVTSADTAAPVGDMRVSTVGGLRAGVAAQRARTTGSSPGVDPSTPATLVYTSGTTGAPKGCVLTHGNLWAAVHALPAVAPEALGPGRRALLGLPLAHAYPRVLALSLVMSGTPTWLTDVPGIAPALPVVRPTFLAAVPRLLERLVAAAMARGDAGSVLRALLGGACEVVLTAGAPLRDDVGHALTAAEVTLLDAWGMTETTTLGAMTRPGHWQPGTIGPASPGTALRLAPDGELQVRGPGCFAGFWQDARATQEAFTEDGWLRTGDLADLDAQGRLSLRGRSKDLLVTSGGKNVAPAPLEAALTAGSAIEQAVVIGDGRPFVAAIVTVPAAATAPPGTAPATPAVLDLGRDGDQATVRVGQLPEEVSASVAAAVREVNARVSRAESIRRVAVLQRPFEVARGELTPTMKVRRGAILEQHQDLVRSLYADDDASAAEDRR